MRQGQFNNDWEQMLKTAVVDSLKHYAETNNDNTLADLYLRFDKETVSLFFYDDVEIELNNVSLDAYGSNGQELEKQIRKTYKALLPAMEKEGLFDQEFIFKPFTVSMINHDFIVTEELIFVDDETLQLSNDLLVGLDKELDDFLENLLK